MTPPVGSPSHRSRGGRRREPATTATTIPSSVRNADPGSPRSGPRSRRPRRIRCPSVELVRPAARPDPGGTSGPTGPNRPSTPGWSSRRDRRRGHGHRRPGSAGPAADPPSRLGASTFTIEGRSAPALFVIGWLGDAPRPRHDRDRGHVAAARPPLASCCRRAGRSLSIGLIAGAGSQGIERRVRGGPAVRRPVAVPRLRGRRSRSRSWPASSSRCPLAPSAMPLDGPLGGAARGHVQAVVYVGLVRLLVVDTGALSWPTMGVRRARSRGARRDRRRRAVGAAGHRVTVVVSYVLSGHLPGPAGQPAAADR